VLWWLFFLKKYNKINFFKIIFNIKISKQLKNIKKKILKFFLYKMPIGPRLFPNDALVYCDLSYTLSSQLISLRFLIASANRIGGAPQICPCVSMFCRLVYKFPIHLNLNFMRKGVKFPSV